MNTRLPIMIASAIAFILCLSGCDHGDIVKGHTSTQDLITMYWECNNGRLEMLVENTNANTGKQYGTQIILNGSVIASTDLYPYKYNVTLTGINTDNTIQIATSENYTVDDTGAIVFTATPKYSSISKFVVNVPVSEGTPPVVNQ